LWLACAILAIVLLWIEQRAERGEETAGRYKAALELLGEPHARVGGIHLLERLVQDAPRTYHRPMVETLTTFIRTSAPWPPPSHPDREVDVMAKRRPSPDVQAAVTALGQRDRALDGPRSLLRLSDVNLRGVSLRAGHFEGIRLRRSRLENAVLEGAQLQEAKLRDAHFEGADFSADPEEGLGAANLEGASLIGANFKGANLTGARLAGAVYNKQTRWPDNFDPDVANAILSE